MLNYLTIIFFIKRLNIFNTIYKLINWIILKYILCFKIDAMLDTNTTVEWCKNTNVIPQVIGKIPSTIFMGGFSACGQVDSLEYQH